MDWALGGSIPWRPSVAAKSGIEYSSMHDGFVQRGGLWVLVQCGLMLAVLGLCWVERNESRNLTLLFVGLFFLTVPAGCGLAGLLALGRNLSPFPKPAATAKLVQRGIYGILR